MKKSNKFLGVMLTLVLTVCMTYTGTFTRQVHADTREGWGETVEFQYDYYEDGHAELTKYIGTDKKVTIPSKIGQYKVTKLAVGLFKNNTNLQNVIIGSYITEIGDEAFSGMTKLMYVKYVRSRTAWENITIGKNNTDLTDDKIIYYYGSGWEYRLFDDYAEIMGYSSNNLELVMPGVQASKPVKVLGQYALCDANFESITLPNSLETISNDAFSGCKNLRTIIIGNGIKTIEVYAFDDCDSLTDVYFNGTEEEWNQIDISVSGNDALLNNAVIHFIPEDSDGLVYQWCDYGKLKVADFINGDTEAIVPLKFAGYSVVGIGTDAFRNSNIEKVTLPSSIKTIGSCAFAYCTKLSEILLPEKLEQIGMYAFAFTNISTIKFPSGLKTIGDEAFTGSEMKYVELPASLESLGGQAFKNTPLKDVTIHKGVKKIGYEAFDTTQLKKITLPSSVTEIGERAFGYNTDYSETPIKVERVNGFIVEGYPNTIAESFAKDNNFAFLSLEKTLYDVNITGVIAPVDGDSPSQIADDTEEYKVESIAWYNKTDSKWMKNTDEFEENKVYEANVHLQTINGYSFALPLTLVSATINGMEAATESVPESDPQEVISVSCEFTAKGYTISKVSKVAILELEKPKAGEHPDYSVKTEEADAYRLAANGIQKSGLYWYDSKDNILEVDDVFVEGETYKVEMKLERIMVNGRVRSEFVLPVTATINGEIIDNDSISASSSIVHLYQTYICEDDEETTGQIETTTSEETTTPVETTTDETTTPTETTTPIETTKDNETTTPIVTTKTEETTVNNGGETKAKQPLQAKAKKKTVKRTKVLKAAKKLKKVISIKNNQGTVTYKKVKKGSSKYLKISKKGVITVKKGKYKKGAVLKLKVKVTASGNEKYEKGSKIVTVKIKIK